MSIEGGWKALKRVYVRPGCVGSFGFRVFEAVSPSCSGLYRSQACAERAYAMRTTGWCKKMDLNLPFPTVGTHRGLPCRNSPMCFMQLLQQALESLSYTIATAPVLP